MYQDMDGSELDESQQITSSTLLPDDEITLIYIL